MAVQLGCQLYHLSTTIDDCAGFLDRRQAELRGDTTVAGIGRASWPLPEYPTCRAATISGATTRPSPVQHYSMVAALSAAAGQRVGVCSLLFCTQRGADEDGLLVRAML